MLKEFRKENHPIRLVRKAYAQSGFRHLSSAAGFSRMIGCSDSLVRNTENGTFACSDNLASRIEEGTGVSRTWLKEADMKWREDGCIFKGPILNTEGKTWMPHEINRYHFVDKFLHEFESLYGLYPELVPAFMGSVMESFLTVETSSLANPLSQAGSESERKRITTSYIFPVIKLIDDLGEDDQQKFFGVLESCLGGRDSATSEKLQKMWSVMHTKDQYGICLGRKERTEAPAHKQGGTESGSQTKSVLRHFRTVKTKAETSSDSVS